MKILIYIFAFTTFTSCNSLKIINNQKITSKSDTLNFELKNNIMILSVELADSTYDFFFDTGATPFVLHDTTIIKNYYRTEKYNFGIAMMAGSTKAFDKILLDLNTEMFSATNQLVPVIIPEKNQCSDNLSYKGIIGAKYFNTEPLKIVKFDFDSKKVILINETEINENLKTGFAEIKSEFFFMGYFVKIFLTITGVEEPFLFDTGNSVVSLLLNADSKIKLDAGIEYTGAILKGADHILNDKNRNTFYENIPVNISGQQIYSVVMSSDFYQLKDNNVGLSFISQFNWIVDYKNEKVYFKKNSLNDEISKSPVKKQYKATDNGSGEIIIAYKLKELTEYNVGDKLLSVNGVKITKENECEILNLLNNTEDWKTLTIEIEKT